MIRKAKDAGCGSSTLLMTVFLQLRFLCVAAFLLVGTTMIAPMPTAFAADKGSPSHEAADESHWVRRVDAEIDRLKDKLHITTGQLPRWNALADAMRENARRIRLSRADRAKIHPTNAIDKLYADRRETQARLERLERVIPVAEALYAVLDANQRSRADELFGGIRQPSNSLLNTQ